MINETRGNSMKKVVKTSMQAIVLMGIIFPGSASAGILSSLETQCQCLTESATIGQLVSLAVMLTLVTGITVLKWVSRSKRGQTLLKKKSEADIAALQVMNKLKIGARFSDWSNGQRLAGHK